MGVDLIGVFVSVPLLTDLVSRRSMLIAVVVHTEVTTAFDELRKKELWQGRCCFRPLEAYLSGSRLEFFHRFLVSFLERAG